MANKISTVRTYPLNGAVDFTITFEYLARKFVKVTLIGKDRKELVLNQDYRFTTKTQITTSRAWTAADGYQMIEIRRFTSASDRLVDFADGSILRAYDLNISQIQTLHVAEEARDLTADTIGVNNDGHLDARGRRIVNLANAVDDRDAVPLGQLKTMNQNSWQARNEASQFRNEAETFRNQAEGFKNESSTNATNTNQWRYEAKGFRDEAEQFKNTSGQYADAASSSAGNAKDSEDEARRISDSLRKDLVAAPGGASLITSGVIARANDRFSIMQGRSSEYLNDGLTYGLGVILNDPITDVIPNANTAKFNYLAIVDDQVNAVDDTAPGTKVDGLQVNHIFGGSNAKGGRHAAEFVATHKAPTSDANPDRNYVGVVGLAVSQNGDGGTVSTSSSTFKGAYFGGNMYGSLSQNAVGVLNVTACEFNTVAVAGSSVWYRSGIQVVGGGAVQGSAVDAGIALSNLGTATARWRNAIRIGNMNGGHALAWDSKIMVAFTDVPAITSGFEIPKCSTAVLKSGDINLQNDKLTISAATSSIELGSTTTAGTTYIDFHSSGNQNDYDSRISSSGGTSSTGGGIFGINSGIIQLNASTEVVASSNIRPGTDNTLSNGTASRRWSVVYAGTGTINTSNEKLKERVDILEAERAAALEIKSNIWKFRFKDAIANKGDGARYHFGVGAQSVGNILRKHGLNPEMYAFYCHDTWDAEYEPIYAKRTVLKEQEVCEVDDLTGTETVTTKMVEVEEEYDTGEMKCTLEAGENFGIRYEELLCFIMAAI